MTDVGDPSTGLPLRQPSDGVLSQQPGGTPDERLPGRQTDAQPGRHAEDQPGRKPEAKPGRKPEGVPDRQVESAPSRPAEGFPSRTAEGFPNRTAQGFPSRPAMAVRPNVIRPPRPPAGTGRHRRPVPASLPQSAPALVIAVPGTDTELSSGPVGELAAVLRVDNPAVDVRAARIDGGGPDDPNDIRAVLADAAARRPAGAPCAVVVPLIATPNPPLTRRLREAIAETEVNALVSGFNNSNALIAEVLHIRLAEAGLARADRVRLFSIVTAADGILVATIGGPGAAAAANVTSVLLAARLALPVIPASLDSAPSLQEGAMRLKEMGVNRIAIAPCFIGPEASNTDLSSLAVGAEFAAPLGAHGNIAKLAAMSYGQAISQLEIPGEPV